MQVDHVGDIADMSSHDLKKFVMLMLKGNGGVLEDLYSLQTLQTSGVYWRLKELGMGCITKKTANHYNGMAFTQQRRLASNETKKLIHVYRCLLMGIHAMRAGTIEMNLSALASEYHYPQLTDLIEMRRSGHDGDLPEGDLARHKIAIGELVLRLEDEQKASGLPEEPTQETRNALEDIVVWARIRMGGDQ